MLSFSYFMLALASIIAALLPYRQSAPLAEKSKRVASIVSACCLLIFLSAIVPLIVNGNSEDSQILRQIFDNLQLYLALPLISTIIMSYGIGKDYSKAAWGRWSLVLLAMFELCRRADIGDYYSISIAVLSSVCIAIGLIYKVSIVNKVPVIALLSFALATIMLSPNLSLNIATDSLREACLYNFSLSAALCLVCLCFGKRLSTIDSTR